MKDKIYNDASTLYRWMLYSTTNTKLLTVDDAAVLYCTPVSCVISHIKRIGCQPEKLLPGNITLHGGQSRSWSAKQRNKYFIEQKKCLAAPPVPPPPQAAAAGTGTI